MNILLTPARIGPVTIPNRIVMPPMTTRGSDEEGHVTEQTIAYYMARVHGGTGLITVEMASPEKAGRHRRRPPPPPRAPARPPRPPPPPRAPPGRPAGRRAPRPARRRARTPDQ